MDGEGSKSLGGSLREANIRKRLLTSCGKDVINSVRDVVEGKLVDGVIPESSTCGRVMNVLLGILVTTVVAKLAQCQLIVP